MESLQLKFAGLGIGCLTYFVFHMLYSEVLDLMYKL
jgi:hypothetical protein